MLLLKNVPGNKRLVDCEAYREDSELHAAHNWSFKTNTQIWIHFSKGSPALTVMNRPITALKFQYN